MPVYLKAGKNISRAWFRSTDLWVMGPARFHCATLLMKTKHYMLTKGSCTATNGCSFVLLYQLNCVGSCLFIMWCIPKHCENIYKLVFYQLNVNFACQCIWKPGKWFRRAWFRSTDLWVMGPSRFHCTTRLLKTKQYMPTKGSCTATNGWSIKYILWRNNISMCFKKLSEFHVQLGRKHWNLYLVF